MDAPMELTLRVALCLLVFLCLYELSSCSAQEKCAKCEADATMWVTGETLTLEHPKQYLVYLCPEHFADEHEAREK
jgi:hypothetical protein